MARVFFSSLLIGVLLFSLVSSVPSVARVNKREVEREQEDTETGTDDDKEIPIEKEDRGDNSEDNPNKKDDSYPYQPFGPSLGFPSIFHPRPSLHNFGVFDDDDGFSMDFAFPMKGLRSFFREVEDAMHEIFSKVSNDTEAVPENINETNTEIVEINGQKYKVKTTVVKKGNDESSMYVRVVTMEPTDRKKREARQIEVPIEQKRRKRSLYSEKELESEQKKKKRSVDSDDVTDDDTSSETDDEVD